MAVDVLIFHIYHLIYISCLNIIQSHFLSYLKGHKINQLYVNKEHDSFDIFT
jgi:hypothetical protein